MRRILVTAAATAFALPLLAGTASAATVMSENASQQGCFGQARAWHSSQGINGEVISTRKGENAALNASYRDACQSA